MGSFAKYVGGSPTNTAFGAARLGLKARADHPRRRRPLRPLHPRDAGARRRRCARRHHRSRAADRRSRSSASATTNTSRCSSIARTAPTWRSREADIDPGLHRARPGRRSSAARICRRRRCSRGQPEGRAQLARAAGGKVVFDIDYRPVLWGLTAPDAGENRFVADPRGHRPTAARSRRLCDLIVGTEEEFHILGGETDHVRALQRRARARPSALLVCKLGARAASHSPGAVGDGFDERRGARRASRSRCSTSWAPATHS